MDRAITLLDVLTKSREGMSLGDLSQVADLPKSTTRRLFRILMQHQLRHLWAGEPLTYDGETVKFYNDQLNFKSRPDISILIVSAGRQILRLAGEVADAVMLGDLASASVIEKALAEVQVGANRSGRSFFPATLTRSRHRVCPNYFP